MRNVTKGGYEKMKFTVKSLIEMLQDFPEDLEIITELSFLWNFPDSVRDKMGELSYEEYEVLTKNNADELLIFEGSWEKDNISDVEGILKEYYEAR
jgi:hypothetical protein